MGFFLLSGAALALPAHADAPSLSVPPSYVVTLTGYNAVPAQTDDNPFVTASGMYANAEIIAARSQDLAEELPFGTIIEIKTPVSGDSCGYDVVKSMVGYRIIADTMNARYNDRVDILFNIKSNYVMADGSVKNASAVLGMCSGVTVRAIGHIDLAHSGKLPKTQAELAAIVKGNNPLALK